MSPESCVAMMAPSRSTPRLHWGERAASRILASESREDGSAIRHPTTVVSRYVELAFEALIFELDDVGSDVARIVRPQHETPGEADFEHELTFEQAVEAPVRSRPRVGPRQRSSARRGERGTSPSSRVHRSDAVPNGNEGQRGGVHAVLRDAVDFGVGSAGCFDTQRHADEEDHLRRHQNVSSVHGAAGGTSLLTPGIEPVTRSAPGERRHVQRSSRP